MVSSASLAVSRSPPEARIAMTGPSVRRLHLLLAMAVTFLRRASTGPLSHTRLAAALASLVAPTRVTAVSASLTSSTLTLLMKIICAACVTNWRQSSHAADSAAFQAAAVSWVWAVLPLEPS